MSIRPLALAGALALAAGPALADMKAPDAHMHFEAIAKGDVSAIMSQYAPDATFQWIGGPLDGSYAGVTEIKAVWQKFTTAEGPAKVKVDDVIVASNPAGMTVTANVQFTGKKTIPVRYVLAYRKGKIVDEIWQIAPNLPME